MQTSTDCSAQTKTNQDLKPDADHRALQCCLTCAVLPACPAKPMPKKNMQTHAHTSLSSARGAMRPTAALLTRPRPRHTTHTHKTHTAASRTYTQGWHQATQPTQDTLPCRTTWDMARQYAWPLAGQALSCRPMATEPQHLGGNLKPGTRSKCTGHEDVGKHKLGTLIPRGSKHTLAQHQGKLPENTHQHVLWVRANNQGEWCKKRWQHMLSTAAIAPCSNINTPPVRAYTQVPHAHTQNR